MVSRNSKKISLLPANKLGPQNDDSNLKWYPPQQFSGHHLQGVVPHKLELKHPWSMAIPSIRNPELYELSHVISCYLILFPAT